MGMTASPASLDLVGLASEISRLSQYRQSRMPEPLTTFLSKDNFNKSKEAIKDYSRYQDDTLVVVSSNSTNKIKHLVLNIGIMFPKTIPINIDLSHIFGTFLDVACLKTISSNKIETLIKKKIAAAIKAVPAFSMTPTKFKLSTIYGEMIRIRRICSKPILVSFYDNLLKREFERKGYCSIKNHMKRSIERINNNFDENF